MSLTCRICQREIPDQSVYCNFCGAPQTLPYRKLFRSSSERQLLGVCGGLAEYWEMDPTVIRVAYAVLTVLTGVLPGILLYVVLGFIMPKR